MTRFKRFSVYYIGPKDTIGIIPDWTLRSNCLGLNQLEGYIETERPILQRDLQFPATQMQRIEEEYHGKFIPFDRTRPTHDGEDD